MICSTWGQIDRINQPVLTWINVKIEEDKASGNIQIIVFKHIIGYKYSPIL